MKPVITSPSLLASGQRTLLLMLLCLCFFQIHTDAVLAQNATTPEIDVSQQKGIKRFIKIDEGLYRGEQPKESEFEWLKAQGIRTVVNFRREDDERVFVEKLGLRYVHIPLSASKRIPDEAIHQFLALMKEADQKPIFIHCRRGADRTGVMVGFYRIAEQGWDGERAYREAREIGMRPWYGNLKKQLLEFAQAQKQKNAPTK
jgi:uncharacterized protein (TIGR01244 family)